MASKHGVGGHGGAESCADISAGIVHHEVLGYSV